MDAVGADQRRRLASLPVGEHQRDVIAPRLDADHTVAEVHAIDRHCILER